VGGLWQSPVVGEKDANRGKGAKKTCKGKRRTGTHSWIRKMTEKEGGKKRKNKKR